MGPEGGLNKKQESVFTREPNLASVDFYERLGLDNKASDTQITRAFRALAKVHHTDTGTGNLENAQLIGEAYEALGDPEKRASYDTTHALPELEPEPVFSETVAPETAAETSPQERGAFTPEPQRDKNGKVIIAGDIDIAAQKMGYENFEAFTRADLSQSSNEQIDP